MQIARVVLGVPLHRSFDYQVPENEELKPEDIGRRVRVRFGRRPCIGIIVGIAETQFSTFQIKFIGKF